MKKSILVCIVLMAGIALAWGQGRTQITRGEGVEVHTGRQPPCIGNGV